MSTEAAGGTIGSQARVARPFYRLGNLQPIIVQQVVGATLNFFLYSMHIAVNLDSDFSLSLQIPLINYPHHQLAFWHLFKWSPNLKWNRFLSAFQSLQNREKIRCTFIHSNPVLFKPGNTKRDFFMVLLKKSLYHCEF